MRGYHSAVNAGEKLDTRTNRPDGGQKTELLCSSDMITGKEKKSEK
jgi:hypothetical protein